MHTERIPFAQVPQFSARDVAYATADPALRPFYKYDVTLDAFARVMADKAADATDRQLLVTELLAQYADLPNAERARTQVQRLSEGNAWTVITAHQPSLFTGPLYFILKICSTINLARQLNARYPDHHVVPVFIMGGEDHDFAEINHARVKGQTVRWTPTGAEADRVGGSVAQLPVTTLAPALSALKDLLGGEFTPFGIYDRIERAYGGQQTYGEATVAFVHDLFRETELVVANPSRPAFKRAFLPLMEREIFERVSQPLVEQAQEQLTAAGFSGQAHARDINLFYLQPGRRDRIVYQDGHYGVLDTALLFTAEEFRAHLHAHPERFSPNVVMRPLFQELIFPNLAYVGGGGELAYWLERRAQFAAFGLNFPMLIRRNSAVWIDAKSQRKMAKLGVGLRDLLRHEDLIIRDYVAAHSANALSLAPEVEQLTALFEQTARKAKAVDPTLEAAALAEGVRQRKILEQFESRLRRVEKKKFDREMALIRELRATLFPGDSLQERKDNFLNVYLNVGDRLFEDLIEVLDPLEPGLVVIRE